MIDLVELKSYLNSQKGTTEETPFGPEALVYKVMGKMFALVAHMDDPVSISLKCDPDDALALRDQFSAVTAGYHLNKRHWNTVVIDGEVPDGEVWRMIDHSYDLVVKGLRKADKEALKSMS